jgi:virginiamycin B lyase
VPALTAPRIAVASLRQFDVPTAGAEPFDIAAGPDGSMWFTEFRAAKIGRINSSGKVTEPKVPTSNGEPYQITAGPDRSVWFTEYNSTSIGRVTLSGQVTQIKLPRPSYGGAGITSGLIGRITSRGSISELALPTPGSNPSGIAKVPAGTICVTETGPARSRGSPCAHLDSDTEPARRAGA